MPEPSGPDDGTQVCPSLSEKETLQVGDVADSSAAKTRPVWRSVNPIGSESITCEVGAARLLQVALTPPLGQRLEKLMNKVSRSDWKFVTPPIAVLDAEFQFTSTEGSPAPRPMNSTVAPVVVVTGVRIPGASKFSYPTLGPLSEAAAGGAGGVSETTVAVPWYWSGGV